MRTINVTTDVYAAIWAARQQGEDTESDILARLLSVPDAPAAQPPPSEKKIGWADPRFGIELPEGFEIFRIYKGTEYRAKAQGGQWVLPDGRSYPSLNQLSRATSGNIENAWQNWYFLGSDGRRQLITGLRNRR
jgi:hypothetical protein